VCLSVKVGVCWKKEARSIATLPGRVKGKILGGSAGNEPMSIACGASLLELLSSKVVRNIRP
jgi:hypothetical protein